MVIPALILGLGLSGGLMRLTRAQMLEVLRQDYVLTAAAKGLAEWATVTRHALKNAFIPVLTLLGLQISILVSGTVVLESIFVLPGMGRYLLEAVQYRDYPVIQALNLLFATVIVLTNLIVDLLLRLARSPGAVHLMADATLTLARPDPTCRRRASTGATRGRGVGRPLRPSQAARRDWRGAGPAAAGGRRVRAVAGALSVRRRRRRRPAAGPVAGAPVGDRRQRPRHAQPHHLGRAGIGDGRLRRGRPEHAAGGHDRRPVRRTSVAGSICSVQRVVDIWISFPALVLLVSLIAVIGPGLWSVTFVLGVLLAPGTSRVVRGAVIGIRHLPYIEAARCVGAGDARMIARHVLPNVYAPIIVLATVQLGAAILAESTLSFLGYGIPPPFPAWGAMLSGTGRAFMLQSPWLSIWPGPGHQRWPSSASTCSATRCATSWTRGFAAAADFVTGRD